MSIDTTDSLREPLIASRDALMASIAGMSDEAFRQRTRSGEWNIAEVLAHALDYERIWLERAQRTIARDGYTVTSHVQGEPHLDLARRMPVPQIVHALLALRRDTLRLLDRLTPPELAHTFTHERHGTQPVVWVFRRLAEHETEHADQIRAARAAGVGSGA